LPETPEPNLSLILDFRFNEIEAELSVILDHAEAVERQLPAIAKSERERLEEGLEGLDPDEWYGTKQWIDEFAEEVLPRLYRSPVIVELWAVFEAAIVEISKYLKEKGGHSLDVDDLRGSNDYERAQKYYADVLGFRLMEIEGVKEKLDTLLLVRNVIAHCNGRVEAIKPARLQKISRWEKEQGGIVVGFYYVSVTEEFIKNMARAVKTTLDDLIKRVKEKY
jgi:hypothetical protein